MKEGGGKGRRRGSVVILGLFVLVVGFEVIGGGFQDLLQEIYVIEERERRRWW